MVRKTLGTSRKFVPELLRVHGGSFETNTTEMPFDAKQWLKMYTSRGSDIYPLWVKVLHKSEHHLHYCDTSLLHSNYTGGCIRITWRDPMTDSCGTPWFKAIWCKHIWQIEQSPPCLIHWGEACDNTGDFLPCWITINSVKWNHGSSLKCYNLDAALLLAIDKKNRLQQFTIKTRQLLRQPAFAANT